MLPVNEPSVQLFDRVTYSPMEQQLHLAVKSLRATGTQPVNKEKTPETQLEGAVQGSLNATSFRNVAIPIKKLRGKRAKKGKEASSDDDNLKVIPRGLATLPPLNPQRIYERRVCWRFGAGALALTAFTLADGANQFLVTTNTTGSLVCYADAWRIKEMDFYLKDSPSDKTVFVYMAPNTVTTDNFLDELPRQFTMMSAGQQEYAHYKVITHPRHPLGSWHKGSSVNYTGTLFSLQTGSAMEDNCCYLYMTFEWVPNLVGTVPGYGISSAGTTVSGEFYTHSIMGGNLIVQGQNNLS